MFSEFGRAGTPLDGLLVTAGTTLRDASGRDWAFITWNTLDASGTGGRTLRLYAKSGDPASPGTYALRSVASPITDPTVLAPLLQRSISLGDDIAGLSETIAALLQSVPGIATLPLEQQLSLLVRAANTNAPLHTTVVMLSRVHPAVAFAIGTAFAELFSNLTTYELREVDPISGQERAVLGRVTLQPGPSGVVVLPAPGKPFQVTTNHPSDDLVIRLRWGTPDSLRRLTPLHYGFNLWRLPKAYAISRGYDRAAPSRAALFGDPQAVRVNRSPLFAGKVFSAGTGPGSAEDVIDRDTYFATDDNRNSQIDPRPFADGEEFAYFVTARDLLGRDGEPSLAGMGKACRRVPPSAPTGLKVANRYGAQTSSSITLPYLELSWQQNTNLSQHRVTHYYIYRWAKSDDALLLGALPTQGWIGKVAHVAGATRGTFNDWTVGAPGPQAYWYTVRAVDELACDPLYSPHSGPAFGVVRQREGPPAPTGGIVGFCSFPGLLATNTIVDASNGLSENDSTLAFVIRRQDAGIAWIEIAITNGPAASRTGVSLGRFFWSDDKKDLQLTHLFPVRSLDDGNVTVTFTVGSFGGTQSVPLYQSIQMTPGSHRFSGIFVQTGIIQFTTNGYQDPLLPPGIRETGCSIADSSIIGSNQTVGLHFSQPAITRFEPPMLIEINSPDPAAVGVWIPVGIANPSGNGWYALPTPPQLASRQTPVTFMGCPLYELGDDCPHLPRPNDAGTVEPIRIRVHLTERTHEYRIYRQTDGGPLTLLSQGRAVFDATSPFNDIVRTDDTMPVSPARLCYYAQLFDENGNGSAMSFLGCKTVLPPTLPRPSLSEPLASGTEAAPEVRITWSCPPAGVERFQVFLQYSGAATSAPPSNPGTLPLHRNLQFPHTTYVGSAAQRSGAATKSYVGMDSAFFTSPVGSADLGSGPSFTITYPVTPNTPYTIAVQAWGPGFPAGGPISTLWTFTWKPTPAASGVPWPMRPFPPVATFDDTLPAGFAPSDIHPDPRIQAVHFTNDLHYPIGIRIGALSGASARVLNIGGSNIFIPNTNFIRYQGGDGGPGPVPDDMVFRRHSADPSRAGNPLLPIALYRQQVTNAVFPKVSGVMTQVTPMIESLAYTTISGTDSPGRIIVDRLIGARFEPSAGASGSVIGITGTTSLFLRDPQPVTVGATYRYYVVHFNPRKEPDQVIPAGEVTIDFGTDQSAFLGL